MSHKEVTLERLRKAARSQSGGRARALELQNQAPTEFLPARYGLGALGLGVAWAVVAPLAIGVGGVEAAVLSLGVLFGTTFAAIAAWFAMLFVFMRKKSDKMRQRAAWVTSLVLAATLWMFIGGPFIIIGLVMAGVGAAYLPRLGVEASTGKETIETEALLLGIPASICAPLATLQGDLPDEIEATLNKAITDYLNVEDLLLNYETTEYSLIDPKEVLGAAAGTLGIMFKAAPLAIKLGRLAETREDDEQILKSRDIALGRVRDFGQKLHDAVAAATRYVASEATADASELQDQVENLQVLAEAREEMELMGI